MEALKMKDNKYPGYLITFCGLDGSGKTSMIRLLTEHLKTGRHCPTLTRQPTNAVRNSPMFRAYMDSPDHGDYNYRSLSLLAASDRIQHTEQFIEPIVRNGGLVISDRYFYSCLANLRARGYYSDHWIYEIARHILRPTISFFLDVPVETAVIRVRKRMEEKDRYIDMELQYRLRDEYLQIAEKIGGIVISTEVCEEIGFQKIMKEVGKRIR